MTKPAEEPTSIIPMTPLLTAPRFYIVSKNKFIVMFLLTLGYYYTYWLYKNWKTYRIATNARVLPLIRTIMGVLFIYSLHMKIDRQLYLSHTHYRWHPRLLALSLIVSEFVGVYAAFWPSAPGAHPAIPAATLLFNLFCLLRVQSAINHLENDPLGQQNSKITAANCFWISLTGIGLALLIYTAVMAKL